MSCEGTQSSSCRWQCPVERTPEDEAAWADVVFRLGDRGRLGSVLWTRSLMQDTSDASLMWRAQWRNNRDATDLWMGSTLWVEIRGKRQL